MPADEITFYRPVIRESYSNDGEWCASFSNQNDKAQWVQVLGNLINVAYPYTMPPEELIRQRGVLLLDKLTLDSWEPETFATFKVKERCVETMATLVDQLFIKVVMCDIPTEMVSEIYEVG